MAYSLKTYRILETNLAVPKPLKIDEKRRRQKTIQTIYFGFLSGPQSQRPIVGGESASLRMFMKALFFSRPLPGLP